MSGLALVMVLGSGLLHAIWNLLTKRSGSQMAFLWWAQWTAVLVFVPLAWLLESEKLRPLGAGALGWLTASMALHGAYIVLLALAYKVGDLSVVYPIVRGAGPVLVPLWGVLALGNHLSLLNTAGLAAIVLGIVLLGKRKQAGAAAGKVVLLALSVGLLIASYTIVDQWSVAHAGIPPVSLNAASNIGNGLILTWFALREGRLKLEWRNHKGAWFVGGLFASGGYTLFLFALQLAPIARLAPMREIGTVFGTLLGVFLLKESQGPARIAASICITLGVIAIAL